MTKENIKEIIANQDLIAFCGLYCGACRSYLTGKCPGCRDNVKASWCKIRICNMESGFKSCAECKMDNIMECKKFNNFISRIFGLVFNSDRAACVARIKDLGYEGFAIDMAQYKRPSIKRK